MKPSEALQAAHDSLTDENWHKGSYFAAKDGKVCMCVHGAIQAQINERVKLALQVTNNSAVASAAAAVASAAAAAEVAAAAAVAAGATASEFSARPTWTLSLEPHYISGMVGLTAKYNDSEYTTLQDVKAKLIQAKKLALTLEKEGLV